MIDVLIVIILAELIVLLAIQIVYWADYTNSYLHCHCNTEPCDKEVCAIENEIKYLVKQLRYWKGNYDSLYNSVKEYADDEIVDGRGTVVGVLFDDK